jgi:hypothetical protein
MVPVVANGVILCVCVSGQRQVAIAGWCQNFYKKESGFRRCKCFEKKKNILLRYKR